MFDTLFRYPAIVARHQGGRFAAARELFLNHCAGQGMAHATLQRYAQELFSCRRAHRRNRWRRD